MVGNRWYVLFSGFAICFLLVASCGGGGDNGGNSPPASITVVSVDSAGAQGDSNSYRPSVSSDGRYVAFDSTATNLVPDDTNGYTDIFLHDTQTGITSRVSVSAAGTQANSGSMYPSISPDGRYVAFATNATNLLPGTTPNYTDIFVYDRTTPLVTLASVSTAGTASNGGSNFPYVSSNGLFVAFESYASSLAPDITNGSNVTDVFVRDTTGILTERVSVSTAGTEGDVGSHEPVISDDGRYVAFFSDATTLVQGDTNGGPDVFLHDRNTGITSCLSVSPAGTVGNDNSYRPSMSSDGQYVVFDSYASNLVADDTNNNGDIFIRNTLSGITSRVSVSTAGTQANLSSSHASISADGRYVAFVSLATNLVPDDNNGLEDVFVHDRDTGTTSRVSVSASGVEHNGHVYNPVISPGGRYIVFESDADNLIDGVTLSGMRHIFLAPRP